MNSPQMFVPGLMAAAAVLAGLWWARSRYLDTQRRSMRAFHALSEDIIAAGSPEEITEKLADVLPSITQATSGRLYLFDARTKSLDAVPTAYAPEAQPFPD